MRIVWVTDIHLNFLRPPERSAFYLSIRDAQPEAVFITGDIAEAPCLRELLLEMQQAIARRTRGVGPGVHREDSA